MTDISFTAKWDCVIALDDWLSANRYKCKLYFDIETDNGDHQNTSFERCKVVLEELFANSIFISLDNPLLQSIFKKTKQRIVSLPDEPLDVIVAALVFNKCNAVTEGNMILNKVELSSSQGENIVIHYDQEFNQIFSNVKHEMFETIKEIPWWFRQDASTSDWFEKTKKEVKFHKHKAEWDNSLQWGTEKVNNKPKSTWKPEIIDGGKTQH